MLPGSVLEVANVLRQAPHGGHDQSPGQLCRGDWVAYALGDRDAALGAGRNVNVAANASGLRDEFEFGEFFDEGAWDPGAFSDQYDHIDVFQAQRELTDSLDGVRIDLGVVRLQFACTFEFAHSVLIVVEYHDIHARIVPRGTWVSSWTRSKGTWAEPRDNSFRACRNGRGPD